MPLQEKDNHLSNRQRSSSLSSFHRHTAVSTERLNEPGWFSHAFHGSGACTCSLLVGSHHLEDHSHHDNSNPDPAASYDGDLDRQQDDSNVKNGNSDHDHVDDGINNNNDDNTECVRTDHEANDIANESSVELRTDEKETNGCIGGDTKVEDVEVDCSNNKMNSGTTCNGIHVTKLQHLTTVSGDSIECHTEESNGNRHQNKIVHDVQEVVNHHPTTSFSDEPSLLSSSPSSSSSSLFHASNNLTDNNFINDELITKVGDLAEENGVLLDKCKKLEEELIAMKTTAPTQKELLDENKAMLFMAAISTTMIESFRVGNENLRKLSSFLSTSTNNQGSSTIDQLTPSMKDQEEYNGESIAAATASHKMNPITEMRQEEVLEMIQDVQAENDALHKSMKESMQSVIRKSREHMAAMVETHKSTVEEYTTEVNDLRQELAAATSARDVLASEMITLKNELINMTSQLEEAVSVVATEYGVKIATLTEKLDENTSSKQQLSCELESLRKENHKLTIELEEARSLVVFSVHDEMKQEQLSKNSRHSENEELVVEMERLKNENDKLNESVKEMKLLVSTLVNKLSEESASLKVTQKSYEQQEEELNVEKMANTYLREEIESISTEREEAYDACKVLQQEINLLRQKCAKIDERFDGDDSIPSSVDNSNQDKLSELSNMNESLTRELDKKNEALQAVQTVLTSLKEEQSVIKKTITELRTENAELRGRAKKSASPSPSVPPPPPKSTLKHKTSLDSSSDSSTQSQILQLEVRLRKVEKENKGLREANNIMSTKLFDEMEKTESLKIANEGLGARICKLVKFIQQNSGGTSSGSCGGEGPASSISIPGKTR